MWDHPPVDGLHKYPSSLGTETPPPGDKMGTFRLADQCGNQLTRLILPRQMGEAWMLILSKREG